ncbi:MAG: hypothetical protein AAGI03_15640 [Pseudomonadota bacterium]
MRRRWTLTAGIVLVAGFGALITFQTLLASLDHRLCFDRMLGRETPGSIYSLSFAELVQGLLTQSPTDALLVFGLWAACVLPLLLSLWFVEDWKDVVAFLVVIVLLGTLLSRVAGWTPAAWHDCDRKGTDAGHLWLMILMVPWTLLITPPLAIFLFGRRHQDSAER